MNKHDLSRQWFEVAKEFIPGGVNSPVRAFKAVGGEPVFIQKGAGSRVVDIDGNEYIDYVSSWGPLILGHSHPQVVESLCQAAQKGTSYGAPCLEEIRLAQYICEAIPSIEKVRMVNSGTEATMSAIRLARAYTGRDKIVKFEGCFHGHGDSFLIKAGSGLMTAGIPESPGVPLSLAELTINIPYNNPRELEKVLEQEGENIAAVIVEPVAGNMGLVLPEPHFLPEIRSLTRKYGVLLIFDEVITGFRTCYGGYQNLVDIQPDLTTLGKIIGGGLPVGAYGGKKEIMNLVAPEGAVYQAGTLSGNPLAMTAGAKTLEILKNGTIYQELEQLGIYFTGEIISIFADFGIDCSMNRLGSMFSLFFTTGKIRNYDDVKTCDTARYARYFRAMLEQGIYLPPSQFEVCFLSQAHTLEDIEKTLLAIAAALPRVNDSY